jgi:hypothetical protein
MSQSTAQYTRRIQTMFTPHQYELLREYAEECQKPLGVIVRETVVQYLLEKIEQRRKQKALEWLCSQELPVDDWEAMERQVETMWETCG